MERTARVAITAPMKTFARSASAWAHHGAACGCAVMLGRRLFTGAFLAFLMSITSRAKATTEYAILSSIFAFSRAVAGWAGGIGAQEMGYANYFFLTFWLSFPAYLLLPQVRRMLQDAESK